MSNQKIITILFVMTIYLIRHGESTSDVKHAYNGNYDDHLTEQGMREARIIAGKLRCSGIEIVFSSPTIRSKETARVISKSLGCDVKIISDLAEQNIYGAYLKLGKEHPEEEYRKLGEVLINRSNVVEGAETYEDFKHRVIRGFSTIIKDSHKTVAIITHGGPIRCIFREILKRGEFRSIHNGAIIELCTDSSGLKVMRFDGAKLEQSAK